MQCENNQTLASFRYYFVYPWTMCAPYEAMSKNEKSMMKEQKINNKSKINQFFSYFQ